MVASRWFVDNLFELKLRRRRISENRPTQQMYLLIFLEYTLITQKHAITEDLAHGLDCLTQILSRYYMSKMLLSSTNSFKSMSFFELETL